MEKSRVLFPNHQGQPREFAIAEYDDHIELIRYLTENLASVDIPAVINNKSVTVLGPDCFFVHEEIENLIIPNSVTTICDQAIAMCRRLKQLIIPDSVTLIGSMAFRDCRSLRRCVLPANMATLPEGLFSFCDLGKNAEIVLPAHLKVVGRSFFWAGLFTLKIPDSVERIEISAFDGFDGKVETKLPYDKGWFLPWPYGELVADQAGHEARISGLEQRRSFCSIIEVGLNGAPQKLFFPFDFENKLRFQDPKNQKLLDYYLGRAGDDERQYYKGWLRGMV